MNRMMSILNDRAARRSIWEVILVERRDSKLYSRYNAPAALWHEGSVKKVREHANAFEIQHRIFKNEFIRKADPNFRFTRID